MEIIVIGAGIVGTFHAYFAALSGCKVTLIERNSIPNDSTVQNFGMVATGTIASPGEWDEYAKSTNQIYRGLDEKFDFDITLRKSGSLYLVNTQWENKILQEFAELRPERATYMTVEEILGKYNYVNEDYLTGGIMLKDDMSIDPRRFIHILLKEFSSKRLFRYIPNKTIVSIFSESFGIKVVDADGNQYTAQKVIICSGVEYKLIYPEFYKKSGLRLCKLHMMKTVTQTKRLKHNILSGLSITRYPAFHICPSYNTFKKQIADSIYQRYGIHLLFKQADDGGVIIGDSHEYFEIDGSETIDYHQHQEINNAILKYAREMIDIDFTTERSWLGYYMSHPEKQVLSEQVDENVFVAVGIAGKGMSTGPGFAKNNVENILNKKNDKD